jgi:O-antigen/teichoic acid export membrane protein
VDKEQMSTLLRGSFRVVAWGGAFCALAVSLFAEEITRVAFGQKLADGAPILAVLIWTLPVVLCSGHARYGLTALGEQRKVFFAHVAGLAVLAVACMSLGRVFGAVGYAYGAVAGPFTIWIVAHLFAALDGNKPPPFQIAARPAITAGLILFAASRLRFGVLGELAGLVLFAALGPVLDPRLIGAIGFLGRAKTKGPPE